MGELEGLMAIRKTLKPISRASSVELLTFDVGCIMIFGKIWGGAFIYNFHLKEDVVSDD